MRWLWENRQSMVALSQAAALKTHALECGSEGTAGSAVEIQLRTSLAENGSWRGSVHEVQGEDVVELGSVDIDGAADLIFRLPQPPEL